MEEWKEIKGFEGLYQISNYGNVKSLANDKSRKEKLLKLSADRGGYLKVRLCKDGKHKNKRIHQLVAIAFLPNPYGYTEVNHKDENKLNNRVWVNEDGSVDLEKSNLEWCSAKYNSNYGTRIERIASANTNGKCSKQVYQHTLDETLVRIWPSVRECGRNGYNIGNVAACCNNKYLREGNNIYKNYIWSFKKL